MNNRGHPHYQPFPKLAEPWPYYSNPTRRVFSPPPSQPRFPYNVPSSGRTQGSYGSTPMARPTPPGYRSYSNSPSPYTRSYDYASPERSSRLSSPRPRHYPDEDVGDNESVVYSAGFTFRMGKESTVHKHLEVEPAHAITDTPSSSLSRQITQFLQKSDHALDRFAKVVQSRSGSRARSKTPAVRDDSPERSVALSYRSQRSTSAASIAVKAKKHLESMGRVGGSGGKKPAAPIAEHEEVCDLGSSSSEESDFDEFDTEHDVPRSTDVFDLSDDTSADLSKLDDLSSDSDDEYFDVVAISALRQQPPPSQVSPKPAPQQPPQAPYLPPTHSQSLPAVNKGIRRMGNVQAQAAVATPASKPETTATTKNAGKPVVTAPSATPTAPNANQQIQKDGTVENGTLKKKNFTEQQQPANAPKKYPAPKPPVAQPIGPSTALDLASGNTTVPVTKFDKESEKSVPETNALVSPSPSEPENITKTQTQKSGDGKKATRAPSFKKYPAPQPPGTALNTRQELVDSNTQQESPASPPPVESKTTGTDVAGTHANLNESVAALSSKPQTNDTTNDNATLTSTQKTTEIQTKQISVAQTNQHSDISRKVRAGSPIPDKAVVLGKKNPSVVTGKLQITPAEGTSVTEEGKKVAEVKECVIKSDTVASKTTAQTAGSSKAVLETKKVEEMTSIENDSSKVAQKEKSTEPKEKSENVNRNKMANDIPLESQKQEGASQEANTQSGNHCADDKNEPNGLDTKVENCVENDISEMEPFSGRSSRCSSVLSDLSRAVSPDFSQRSQTKRSKSEKLASIVNKWETDDVSQASQKSSRTKQPKVGKLSGLANKFEAGKDADKGKSEVKIGEKSNVLSKLKNPYSPPFNPEPRPPDPVPRKIVGGINTAKFGSVATFSRKPGDPKKEGERKAANVKLLKPKLKDEATENAINEEKTLAADKVLGIEKGKSSLDLKDKGSLLKNSETNNVEQGKENQVEVITNGDVHMEDVNEVMGKNEKKVVKKLKKGAKSENMLENGDVNAVPKKSPGSVIEKTDNADTGAKNEEVRSVIVKAKDIEENAQTSDIRSQDNLEVIDKAEVNKAESSKAEVKETKAKNSKAKTDNKTEVKEKAEVRKAETSKIEEVKDVESKDSKAKTKDNKFTTDIKTEISDKAEVKKVEALTLAVKEAKTKDSKAKTDSKTENKDIAEIKNIEASKVESKETKAKNSKAKTNNKTDIKEKAEVTKGEAAEIELKDVEGKDNKAKTDNMGKIKDKAEIKSEGNKSDASKVEVNETKSKDCRIDNKTEAKSVDITTEDLKLAATKELNEKNDQMSLTAEAQLSDDKNKCEDLKEHDKLKPELSDVKSEGIKKQSKKKTGKVSSPDEIKSSEENNDIKLVKTDETEVKLADDKLNTEKVKNAENENKAENVKLKIKEELNKSKGNALKADDNHGIREKSNENKGIKGEKMSGNIKDAEVKVEAGTKNISLEHDGKSEEAITVTLQENGVSTGDKMKVEVETKEVEVKIDEATSVAIKGNLKAHESQEVAGKESTAISGKNEESIDTPMKVEEKPDVKLKSDSKEVKFNIPDKADSKIEVKMEEKMSEDTENSKAVEITEKTPTVTEIPGTTEKDATTKIDDKPLEVAAVTPKAPEEASCRPKVFKIPEDINQSVRQKLSKRHNEDREDKKGKRAEYLKGAVLGAVNKTKMAFGIGTKSAGDPSPHISSPSTQEVIQKSKKEDKVENAVLLKKPVPELESEVEALIREASALLGPDNLLPQTSVSTVHEPSSPLKDLEHYLPLSERIELHVEKNHTTCIGEEGEEEVFVDAIDPSQMHSIHGSASGLDPTQLDILMPLPDVQAERDRRSRSRTPMDRSERSCTPSPIVAQTEALLSETDRILKRSRSNKSLRRSYSRSLSAVQLHNKLSEVTADLSEEHTTAHLAGERLEAEQAERMKLEKELDRLQTDVRRMTTENGKLEMEKLALRTEVLSAADLNGDADDDDEDASLYKRKYEWCLREIEILKKQLKQQQEDDYDQLVLMKKQLEKKVADAYEETDEQRQVVAQMKRKCQRLQAEMNDLKILLEEQTSRNNLLEKKQRKFDQEVMAVQEELRGERSNKEKIQRERDQILSQKYSFEQEVSTLKLELELKEEKVASLNREIEDLSFTGKTEEEVATLKKAKHDLEMRIKDQEEELDDLAGQVQMLEGAKVRLEMSIEQMRKENRREMSQREEELEEVRIAAQKKVKALEAQLENEHEERTMLVREKHELERRIADLQDRTITHVDEDYVHKLKKELKKTKVLLRDTQTMLEKAQSEGSHKVLLRQLKTQLEDAEFAKTAAIKARQSAESDLAETNSQLEEALRSKNDAEDKCARICKEKAELQTQLEESEEEVAEVMKKYKAVVSQLSVDQITLSEQSQQIAELEHSKQVLQERMQELTSKVEVLEGETGNIHTQRRLEMKIKEVDSKLELEQTTRQRLESQIGRLKDQIERLTSECDSARHKESQAQDQTKRIGRQLREAKEDLSALQQKHTDTVNKKNEIEKQLELSDSEVITLKSDLKLAFKRIEDLQQAIQGDISDSDSDLSDSDSDSDGSLSSYLTASLRQQRSSSNSTLRTPPSEVQQLERLELPNSPCSEAMSAISEDLEETSNKESFA